MLSAGTAVEWLRDDLGVIDTAAASEQVAAGCADSGGVYFVPAFSGLFAPYWRENARGAILGLTAYANKGHIARACLEETREHLEQAGVQINYAAAPHALNAAAAEFIAMEADWEAARLLTMQAAWMADNKKPNSLQASMAKAKAGRMGTDVALRCVALCGATGYGEGELLEKWARDAKILDLFEGTQQIQLLIVARLLLGLRRQSQACRTSASVVVSWPIASRSA